jgi:hypothetical protein
LLNGAALLARCVSEFLFLVRSPLGRVPDL